MDESDSDDDEIASCCLEQDVVKKIRPNWIVFLPVEHNIIILRVVLYYVILLLQSTSLAGINNQPGLKKKVY